MQATAPQNFAVLAGAFTDTEVVHGSPLSGTDDVALVNDASTWCRNGILKLLEEGD